MDVDEQLWIVWILMDDGWYPGDPKQRNLADLEVDAWRRDGYQARVHPRHSVTLADIIDG